MQIFIEDKNKLKELKEDSFILEKHIQNLIENNLDKIFNLQFINSEIELNGLRIDTLAFNNETNSFVIIEYKKDKNFSVIDQGYAYLALLVNNKADFILEYNERLNKNMRKEDMDWSQSRVIFISPNFTKYQQQALKFRDLPFELWEIKKFENGIITFNQLISGGGKESISRVSKSSEVFSKVNKEVKVYTEEDHLKYSSSLTKEIYYNLKDSIMNLGSVTIKPLAKYIGFKSRTNFTDIVLKKSKLKVFINIKKGQLDDPKNMARDVSKIGHWGNGDYEVHVSNSNQLDYLMILIKQAYSKNLK